MANLDEISMILGEIRSDVKHARAWYEEHEERDEERFRSLADRIDKINGHGMRIAVVEDKIVFMEPVVHSINKFKWIVAGFVAATSLIGGAAAGFASQLFKFLT